MNWSGAADKEALVCHGQGERIRMEKKKRFGVLECQNIFMD